jgi:hypothetical protein
VKRSTTIIPDGSKGTIMLAWMQREWCLAFVVLLGHLLWQGTLIAAAPDPAGKPGLRISGRVEVPEPTAWGPTKNGLRARVIPVLSSMSEDAIDPVKRVAKFEFLIRVIRVIRGQASWVAGSARAGRRRTKKPERQSRVCTSPGSFVARLESLKAERPPCGRDIRP